MARNAFTIIDNLRDGLAELRVALNPLAVLLALSVNGCTGLRFAARHPRVAFGAAAPLPDDAAALGHFFRGEVALAQNDPDTAVSAFEAAVASISVCLIVGTDTDAPPAS